MPDITLSFKIKEANLPAVVKALCNKVGLPETEANARKVALEILRKDIAIQIKAETQLPESNLIE